MEEIVGPLYDQRREGSIRCERIEDANAITVLLNAVKNFSDFEFLLSGENIRKAIADGQTLGYVYGFDGQKSYTFR